MPRHVCFSKKSKRMTCGLHGEDVEFMTEPSRKTGLAEREREGGAFIPRHYQIGRDGSPAVYQTPRAQQSPDPRSEKTSGTRTSPCQASRART
jgi:hypothetical protein